MLAILSPFNNPYLNLAAEEYFLKISNHDIFLTYRNEPSVIVGKHQNAMSEVDIHFLNAHNIVLTRRISGGGAVYHDLGNVNFSFIKNSTGDNLIDFEGFTKPIIIFLQTLGIQACLGGHNSIMVGNRKISGNAEHIYRKRVLHHGTLLFSTNLEVLAKCLYTSRERYSDSAIRSVRANVINLSDLIQEPMNPSDFELNLIRHVADQLNATPHIISATDCLEIEKLATQKYSSKQWILGYSPQYKKNVEIIQNGNTIRFSIIVVNGEIEKIETDDETILLELLQTALPGTLHEPGAIYAKLINTGLNNNTIESILRALF